jgi:hypothetical protein
MMLTSALTVGTQDAGTGLIHAVHDLLADQIDVDEFTRRFLASRVYVLCPVNPGVFVMSRPNGSAIVPVWSTVRALRRVMGGFDWRACSGEDVVVHLPMGVGVLIDDGMPCPIDLPPTVLLQHRLGA